MPNRSEGQVTLRIEEDFDVRAAKRLEELLQGVEPDQSVRIDLTGVARFDDFGVGLLAQTLKHRRFRRLSVLGLRQHQIRVMKYFGFDPTGQPSARAEGTPPVTG